MNRRKFLTTCAHCALIAGTLGLPSLLLPGPAGASTLRRELGLSGVKLSPYFTPLEQGEVRCELCPRHCEMGPGERGYCGVRENRNAKLYSLVHGNPCAVNVDPVEKKPFFHVLPGTKSFSLATAGCNFDCKFCQNWEISQALPEQTLNFDLPPKAVAALARQYACASIASTYVEPTIFMEYMLDIARASGKTGPLQVMHSNGYVNEKPLADLCRRLDAACIDLKSFNPEYYQNITEGELEPVLQTLTRLKKHGIHTELVNLIIPGKNDSLDEIKAMCEWIRDTLGPDTPLHFSKFYPLYKLKSVPPTPVATLDAARETATHAGLNFVYIGNVPGHPGENTFCPHCETELIRRVGYQTQVLGLDNGKCEKCGREIPGIWERE